MKEILIKCKSKEQLFKKGNEIHKQLVGNRDYIDNNIVLHLNEQTLTVELYFDNCEWIPAIII